VWSVEKVVHRAPCQERSGVKIMRISNIQFTVHVHMYLFFKLYAFILLTSALVPGINYFVVTTHPLHQLQVRKRSKFVVCSDTQGHSLQTGMQSHTFQSGMYDHRLGPFPAIRNHITISTGFPGSFEQNTVMLFSC